MRFFSFALLCLLGLYLQPAQSYPNFIGYGYSSCLTCHWNPFGNGPLNPYGRALAANTISDRIFYDSKTTEDEISSWSGPFFNDPAKGTIRPSFDYRGLWLKRNHSEANAVAEFIHMQADANITANFGKNNEYITSVTMGWRDHRRPAPGQEDWITREHYFGHRVSRGFGYYIGLQDKVFGIRHPDHQAYSRKETNLNQNDQSHGVVLHFLKKKFEFGLNGFVGNLLDDNQRIQQKGFSGMVEYSLGQKSVIGYSLLSSTSEAVDQYMNALHTRVGFGKGSSVMAEVGEVQRTGQELSKSRTSQYGFLQTHLLMRRGLFAITTMEYLKNDVETDLSQVALTQGLQWFPIQRIELRTEIQNVRLLNPASVNDDFWSLLGQVHLWF